MHMRVIYWSVRVCSKLYPAGTKPLRGTYKESNQEIILKCDEDGHRDTGIDLITIN